MKMNSLPPIMYLVERMKAAHGVFQSVLGAATPDKVFDEKAVVISSDGKWLTEFTANNGLLAEAVLGADFPRQLGPVDLEHYTILPALKAIVTSQSLHLRSVANYLHAGEFETFAREHNLEGYFADTEGGQKVYEELSDDLFFISLTRPGNPDEPELWKSFANDGKGVCLQLRLTPKPASDLREMSYQTGTPTALKKINQKLANEGLVYTPWTISRICAFYLPLSYHYEKEVRLLVKRHKDGVDRTIDSGGSKAWPVSLAVAGATTGDPCGEIELLGIRKGPRCSIDAVKATLAAGVYSGVPIRDWIER